MNYLANVTRREGDPKVLSSGPSSLGSSDQLTRALGWFSIGLGAMEILAPRAMGRTLGMRRGKGLLSLYGVREVVAGVMTLSLDRGTGLSARVAGDALDIVTLAGGLRRRNRRRRSVRLALALVACVTALDVMAVRSHTARHGRARLGGPRYADRSGFPKGLESARGAAARQAG